MPDTFAQSLVKLLQPMMYDDANHGNALAVYLGALGDNLFQEIEDWASDTDLGQPGYSLLLDADRVPDKAIPWLAQFVGVTITKGLPAADQRSQLKGLTNWKRGTVDALQAAPLPYLTGSKTVIIKERFTGAYNFEVITYTSETPDSASVLAALIAQKPAGLIMTYIVYAGQKAFLMRGSTMRGIDSLRLVI